MGMRSIFLAIPCALLCALGLVGCIQQLNDDFFDGTTKQHMERGGAAERGVTLSAGASKEFSLDTTGGEYWAVGMRQGGITVTVAKDAAFSDVIVRHSGSSPEVFTGNRGTVYVRVTNTGSAGVSGTILFSYGNTFEGTELKVYEAVQELP